MAEKKVAFPSWVLLHATTPSVALAPISTKRYLAKYASAPLEELSPEGHQEGE
jgi:hypothetical protein